MIARRNTRNTLIRSIFDACPSPDHIPARLGRLIQATLLCFLAAACTGVSVERDTVNSGTFSSRAWAFTILSKDLPRPALMIARSNAADIQRPDMRIESEWVAPDLGWFDWLLDIIGFRYAKVSGTWGFPEGSLPEALDEAPTSGAAAATGAGATR